MDYKRRWAVDEYRRRRTRAVDEDRRHEALLMAQVKASLPRINALCVKSMHSVERIMSKTATIPAPSLLCSSKVKAQPTLLQRDPLVADIDFIEGAMSRLDPPSEPTSPPPLPPPLSFCDPTLDLTLELIEKPFYEINDEKYPASPNHPHIYSSSSSESSEGHRSQNIRCNSIISVNGFANNNKKSAYPEYTKPLPSFPYASPIAHGEVSMATLRSGSSVSINQDMSENGDEDEGKDVQWSPDPGGTAANLPSCCDFPWRYRPIAIFLFLLSRRRLLLRSTVIVFHHFHREK